MKTSMDGLNSSEDEMENDEKADRIPTCTTM